MVLLLPLISCCGGDSPRPAKRGGVCARSAPERLREVPGGRGAVLLGGGKSVRISRADPVEIGHSLSDTLLFTPGRPHGGLQHRRKMMRALTSARARPARRNHDWKLVSVYEPEIGGCDDDDDDGRDTKDVPNLFPQGRRPSSFCARRGQCE